MRLLFGEFRFDSERRELSRRGSPVHLTPKAMHLLSVLLDRRPRIVGKAEIYEELWPGTFVEESNVSVLIAEIRAALGEEARRARFIKTVHGFGYGFAGEATIDVPAGQPSDIRLRSGVRDYALIVGENIIGRTPEAAVRLNAPGISRQHARIVVGDDRITIEDLGSKNGTYVRGTRINSTADLHDGDEIRLSRESLVVLRADAARSTVTELG